MIFSKTLVIAINTHGGIDSVDTNDNFDCKTYPITKIPSNIESFIKIDSVPLGIVNIINEDELNMYNNLINKYFGKTNFCLDLMSYNEINDNLIKITNQLKLSCKNIHSKKLKKRKYSDYC